ncbi:MAG: DUF4019 domain-containing protein [Erythrobacter sp.]
MSEDVDGLTDKEKETLRLIVRGHDAKSTANELGLSVHTINERLRSARRKLGVTSSREAARLLMEQEAETPKNLGYKELGEANRHENSEFGSTPKTFREEGFGQRRTLAIIIGGLVLMSLFAALFVLSSFSGGPVTAVQSGSNAAATSVADAEQEEAARSWLALVDSSDWEASYAAAGNAFQTPISATDWREISAQARAPLGNVVRREAITFQNVEGPGDGYQVVQFRTDFEKREGAIESVTLERENGTLKVVGYFIR